MIQTMNFAPRFILFRLPSGTSPALVFKILLKLALVVVVVAFATSALGQSGSRSRFNRPSGSQLLGERSTENVVEVSDDIAFAREKAKTAKKKYEAVKKLSRLGSASQKELRDAELVKWLTLLEFSDLLSPRLKSQNSLLRAELVVNYRNKELAVAKKLYQRGSVSMLEYQRAKTARDVAQSQLKAVESVSSAQRKINLINAASSKYESALQEHRLAAKLLQSGSISQAVMDLAGSRLEAAKSELAEAKKMLGGTASQVLQ